MQKLSSSDFLTIFIRLFILLAVSKVLALSIWWFLPDDGVELSVEENYKPRYQRVDFKNMLINDSYKPSVKQQNIASSSGISITNMILKGLYGKDAQGLAIIALKSSPKKTSLVSVGENFSSYTLKKILLESVVFTKAGKEYILRMQVSKALDGSNKSSITVVQNIEDVKPQKVLKKDIKSYVKNPSQLKKDISIVEVRDGKKIKGFKITRLRKNSQIENLGVRKGDVIIRANNIDLKSYKDALNLYKNIDKLQTIQIVVLRNNEEKEFVYEIN